MQNAGEFRERRGHMLLLAQVLFLGRCVGPRAGRGMKPRIPFFRSAVQSSHESTRIASDTNRYFPGAVPRANGRFRARTRRFRARTHCYTQWNAHTERQSYSYAEWNKSAWIGYSYYPIR